MFYHFNASTAKRFHRSRAATDGFLNRQGWQRTTTGGNHLRERVSEQRNANLGRRQVYPGA